MAQDTDTLNIGTLRAGRKPSPDAEHAPAHEAAYNPVAAARARERIAGLSQHPTLAHPDAIPAARTSDLITNRERLISGGHTPKAAKRRAVPSALGPVL